MNKNSNVVIQFPLTNNNKSIINTSEVNDKVINIREFSGYNLRYNDIIGAINSNILNLNLEYYNIEEEYLKWYNYLMKIIYETGNRIYLKEGLELKYEEKTGLIYLINKGGVIQKDSTPIDVSLSTNKGYSSTSIEVSGDNGLMFTIKDRKVNANFSIMIE